MNKIKTLLVNDRYNVVFNDKTYVIYDTLKAQDIPLYVFKLADKIIQMRNMVRKEERKERKWKNKLFLWKKI